MTNIEKLLTGLTIRQRNRALRDLAEHEQEQEARNGTYARVPAAVSDVPSKGRTNTHSDPTAKRAAFTADWKE